MYGFRLWHDISEWEYLFSYLRNNALNVYVFYGLRYLYIYAYFRAICFVVHAHVFETVFLVEKE